jgi:hypothetical protein
VSRARATRTAVVLVVVAAVAGVAVGAPKRKRGKPAPAPQTTTAPAPPAPDPSPTPAAPAATTTTPPTPTRDRPVNLALPNAALPPPAAPAAKTTRCASCHRTGGWDDVRFDHDRTGFPLKGMHRRVMCKACHAISFKAQIPDTCIGCHRDPHAGEFGRLCASCHDEERWPTTFTADAHRRTNFPLSGRHALIPCAECHPNARDRVFSRSPVTCYTCHQQDYQNAGLNSVDHVASGFSTDCRQCHTTMRFQPARYPDHDRCFPISQGSHAGLRCVNCHPTTPKGVISATCAYNMETCTSCHEHACGRTDPIHTADKIGAAFAMAYKCQDALCYQCHRVAR